MQAGDVTLPISILHLPMAFNDYMQNEEFHAPVHHTDMYRDARNK